MSFKLPKTADIDRITKLLEEKERWLASGKKGIERYRKPYDAIQHIRAGSVDVNGDVVRIGEPGELSSGEQQLVYETLLNLMPWRKGPFEIFGIEIDAEWRSERKWNRLASFLPDLRGKLIADIGSNNGYYMFRMAEFEPRGVIGFEPSIQHYYNFKTMNSWAGFDNLRTELLGVEHIGLYESCFDVIFLMGILYHRSSPIDVLLDIRKAMTPGGTLIVESQGIPGDGPHALFPEKTYAKVPGTYFVPTGRCLVNWLNRAGFEQVELFCSHPMSSQEQRRTDWMVFESYEDFIDQDNPDLTIEGYPAPVRLFVKARKKQ